jgi:hypothetical protein
VIKNGRSKRRYIHIHGNEATAREVLLAHMKTHKGTAFVVNGTDRNVKITGQLLDPNRMFSLEGSERNLKRLNPNVNPIRLNEALDYLAKRRAKAIKTLTPPEAGVLIAVHNNSEGYSLEVETGISQKMHLPKRGEPHEFFLCTDPSDFEKLAGGPYNVLLQNAPKGDDDGSLSRLAVKRGFRYVNLEVALGKDKLQTEMLAWLDQTLA